MELSGMSAIIVGMTYAANRFSLSVAEMAEACAEFSKSIDEAGGSLLGPSTAQIPAVLSKGEAVIKSVIKSDDTEPRYIRMIRL
jgi:hypothetical protein